MVHDQCCSTCYKELGLNSLLKPNSERLTDTSISLLPQGIYLTNNSQLGPVFITTRESCLKIPNFIYLNLKIPFKLYFSSIPTFVKSVFKKSSFHDFVQKPSKYFLEKNLELLNILHTIWYISILSYPIPVK